MKKCKVCKTEFNPVRPMQKVCSPLCALEVSRQATEKKKAKEAQEDRKKTREKLDAMRTKPQLVKLAQIAFNSYIRARDAGKPCICCGKPLGTEPNSFDAGHYRSVGSAPHMRFVEDNVHGQTKYCNNYLASNPVGYRKGLIERIGLKRVEQIESDQTVRKYTKEGLQEIARHYNAEARRLKKEQT
jgi:hypothetical protein